MQERRHDPADRGPEAVLGDDLVVEREVGVRLRSGQRAAECLRPELAHEPRGAIARLVRARHDLVPVLGHGLRRDLFRRDTELVGDHRSDRQRRRVVVVPVDRSVRRELDRGHDADQVVHGVHVLEVRQPPHESRGGKRAAAQGLLLLAVAVVPELGNGVATVVGFRLGLTAGKEGEDGDHDSSSSPPEPASGSPNTSISIPIARQIETSSAP